MPELWTSNVFDTAFDMTTFYTPVGSVKPCETYDINGQAYVPVGVVENCIFKV